MTDNESWCKNDTGVDGDGTPCSRYMTRMYTNPVNPGPAEAWVLIGCPGTCPGGWPEVDGDLLTSLDDCDCD